MPPLLPLSVSHPRIFQSAALAACLLGSLPTANAQQRPVRAQNSASGQLPYEVMDEPVIVLQDGTISGGPLPAPDTAPAIEVPNATSRPQKTQSAAQRSRASVAGVSIRGLTDVAAQKRLRAALAPKLRTRLMLSDGRNTFTLRRDELGASIPYATLIAQARRSGGDVPLRFTVDESRTARALRRLAPRSNVGAEPFRLDLDAQNRVIVRGSRSAAIVVAASTQRVLDALEAQPPRSKVELVVASTGQNGTTEDLSRIRYLLANFSTPYDAGVRGRTNNLRMAAELVNGTIVPDGAVFSTNRAIGPRNAAAGWREAKMFVDGQVVSGTGAGICQCSTTIYNAALLAGLPIVERHQHMFRVSYAPASRDAAIYWGSKDMRFRNNTGGPIYVQTFLRGGRFHARLYGVRPVRQRIEVVSRTLSREGGTRSEAYRIVRSDEGTARERLSRDFYRPHP
ncbi:MAG TPA: VanW family protein [Abditibacteriaceae bacterium]|jgi:vancomycin resistance protein YoaR